MQVIPMVCSMHGRYRVLLHAWAMQELMCYEIIMKLINISHTQMLSNNTRRTKVVELSSGTHR